MGVWRPGLYATLSYQQGHQVSLCWWSKKIAVYCLHANHAIRSIYKRKHFSTELICHPDTSCNSTIANLLWCSSVKHWGVSIHTMLHLAVKKHHTCRSRTPQIERLITLQMDAVIDGKLRPCGHMRDSLRNQYKRGLNGPSSGIQQYSDQKGLLLSS